ncbi:CCAAT/enhancer-binding protein-like [Penaeus monodon]|uniref:CCAAT/enhancer-binding protein-like n=1 Tax=Penaeus monodon TaxID=6687 RepID=UPI0018A7CAEE|nr:CCAAT/enhancer-binding protein-like [Penaeus monodon]
MESPHLYDSADYKKGGASAVKVKAGALLYSGEDYLAELSAPEVSLDLQGLIDDSQFSEGLIQEIQGLSVDKNNVGSRGLGVSNMYNPLAYLPQPVHGASQFERPYPERTHDRGPVIKEEPSEGSHEVAPQEYSACARVGLGGGDGGYGGGGYSTCPPYSMTPTTIPGSDNLCKSPMMSPSSGKLIGGCKKPLDKGSEEYKRRRERNNIAVRKSREKAKARSRETEERVKKLIVDNDRLHKRCEQLTKEVAAFQNMFASMHCLPEHIRREINKQMEAFNQQHQNLVNM